MVLMSSFLVTFTGKVIDAAEVIDHERPKANFSSVNFMTGATEIQLLESNLPKVLLGFESIFKNKCKESIKIKDSN